MMEFKIGLNVYKIIFIRNSMKQLKLKHLKA